MSKYISPGFSKRRFDLDVEQSYHWETRRVTLPRRSVGSGVYFTNITDASGPKGNEQRVVDRTQELVQLHVQLRALTTGIEPHRAA